MLGSFSLQFLSSSEHVVLRKFFDIQDSLTNTVISHAVWPTRQDGFQNRDDRLRVVPIFPQFANKLDFAYKMRQRVISARKEKKTGAMFPRKRPAADPTVLPTPTCAIYCHDLVTQLYMLTCQRPCQIQSNWRGTGDLQLEKVKELKVNLNIFLFLLTPLSCLL